ncbi:substrate-binding domain-containing protein [Arthrobacter sp. SA17]
MASRTRWPIFAKADDGGSLCSIFSSTPEPSQRGAEFLRLCKSSGMNGIIHLDPAKAEPDMEAGKAAVRSFDRQWEPGDAIIAFNDSVAVGVIKELQHENLKVPEDVAVLGIDGLPIGLIVTPELTTLQLDLRDVGNEAVNMVVNMAAGKLPLRGEGVHRRVQHVLVERHSA